MVSLLHADAPFLRRWSPGALVSAPPPCPLRAARGCRIPRVGARARVADVGYGPSGLFPAPPLRSRMRSSRWALTLAPLAVYATPSPRECDLRRPSLRLRNWRAAQRRREAPGRVGPWPPPPFASPPRMRPLPGIFGIVSDRSGSPRPPDTSYGDSCAGWSGGPLFSEAPGAPDGGDAALGMASAWFLRF